MERRERIEAAALALPDDLAKWVGDAPIYESSGHSGAKTVYIDHDGGVYLKIAACAALSSAARMQSYFAHKKMSASVLCYVSADRDYLLSASLLGEDGTADRYIAEPERLSEVFGESLRLLHETDASDCPVRDKMSALITAADQAVFLQTHLDDISEYIGKARAHEAAMEVKTGSQALQNDVLIHGDYCLPNIMLDHWRFTGLIDVADGGMGDRHYDLAWGLWTLNWNLKSQTHGQRFLDAYGWDRIDRDRLRICGLLAAME